MSYCVSPAESSANKGSPSYKVFTREDGLSASSSPIAITPQTEENQAFNNSPHSGTSLIDPIVLSAIKVEPCQSPMMIPLAQQETHQLSHNCYVPVSQITNRCYVPYDMHPASSSLLPNVSHTNTYLNYDYQETYFSNHLPWIYEQKTASVPEEYKRKEPQATFKCTDCHKVFSRPYNLKSHMRTHTHERPYECTHYPCGWKFARPHDLKRHELQHTGQKPHGCRFCTRRFARSDALKRHWKVDTHCAQALKEETRLNGGKQVPYARKKRSF